MTVASRVVCGELSHVSALSHGFGTLVSAVSDSILRPNYWSARGLLIKIQLRVRLIALNTQVFGKRKGYRQYVHLVGYPKAVRVRTSSLCPSLETRPQPGQKREPYPQTQHTISHSERDSSERQSQRLTSVDDWGHRGKKVVRGSVRGSVSPGAMQGTTSA